MNISSDIDLKIIKKIPFSSVDFVFDALHEAFHPTGVDEEHGPDDKFLALWNLFLHTVGWTDEEYWTEYRSNCSCDNCGKSLAETNDSPEKSSDKPN